MIWMTTSMALTMIFVAVTTSVLLSPAAAWTTRAASPAPAPAPHFANLTDVLSLNGPFHTFLAHLIDSQVIKTLQNQANNTPQGVTVLAPSDLAFSSLTKPSLANLTKDQLKSLLLFHALPKFYTLTDMVKNLNGRGVATMAGGKFTLNITDDSGLVLIDSGWSHTSISSSVYSAAPVAVHEIDQVLLPEAIFGDAPSPARQAPPPVMPTPPSPRNQTPPAQTPPSGAGDDAPAPSPKTSEKDDEKSYAHGTSFGTVTGLIVSISGVLILLL